MNILTIVIIAIVSLVSLMGLILLFAFLIKGSSGFSFLLYSKDGRVRTKLIAKIKSDEKNRAIKRFVFPDGQNLPIREPTCYINNKPYREITFNSLGEYSYLEASKFDIDKETYLKLSLEPEEKQLALYRYKEYADKYSKSIDKYQAMTLVAMFIMTLIIGIGVIYSTIAYVNVSGKFVDIAQENTKVTNGLKDVSKIQQTISQQQIIMTGALIGNKSAIRQLT